MRLSLIVSPRKGSLLNTLSPIPKPKKYWVREESPPLPSKKKENTYKRENNVLVSS
jgi:hypothetical protein